ncbi:hypothetical protein, partial [Weizmannia sp. CD-2023]|uniref:hypothetical protein n=1 Tax=Weizmannia sp. CD-2023 TaxID=3037263 RepID=UPI002DB5AE82
ISEIPRFGKDADSFGHHLNAWVLQQIQGNACTRKPIQRMEKIKSPLFAKEFFYILRQRLQINWAQTQRRIRSASPIYIKKSCLQRSRAFTLYLTVF